VEDSRPDRDLAVTGLVTKAVIRRRQNYGAGIDHNFSEKTKVGLAYSYSQEDYTDPEFADLKNHDARMTYIQDLGGTFANVAARLNLGYSRYEYESPIIDYLYGTIGMSWALEEKWSLFLDGGASYVLSQFGPDPDRQRESGTGWVGMAGFLYKAEKTDGNLTFSHRIEPASGSVGVTTRTSFSVGINHRLTYEFSGGLSAGYIINKADEGKFSTVAFNERFFYVNPRLRYEFTRDVALEASYDFAYTKDKLNNTEPRRSLAMLRFYIQHAFFE
jgi:opacity protein-like surface antigen